MRRLLQSGAITGEMIDMAAAEYKKQGTAKWEECKCECDGDCIRAWCCPCLTMKDVWKKANFEDGSMMCLCVGEFEVFVLVRVGFLT